MARIQLPITGGFYKSDSSPISNQACVNMYPYVLNGKPGLSDETLFGCPGLEQLATAGSDSSTVNRGSHEVKGVPYFVQGATLYSMDSAWNLTSLGTINGSGRVSMADNGTQLMIIAQGIVGTQTTEGYIYNTSTATFSTISDADFYASGNPEHVRFVDGYFMCITDEGKHIISALNDGTAYNALDFGSAEVDPDPTKAIEVLRNQPQIFGSETIEGLVNQPVGADYPFRRSGVFVEKGTRSPFTVIKFQERIFFVGGGRNESPAVWMYDGNSAPTKISDEGIDSVLHRLTQTEIEGLFSWAYAQKGFYFVCIVLPTTTLVYELGSGLWHERKSYITYTDGTFALTRNRVNSVVTAYGKQLVGDVLDGRIGYIDIDLYDEYGEALRREFSIMPLKDMNKSYRVAQLELMVESGVGIDGGTEEPMVEMTRSYDGKTWLTPRPRKMGREGEYFKRQIWRKLGKTPRFQLFKFSISGKIKAVAIQLFAEVLPCNK